MRSFVITIPIDEYVAPCIHEIAYRLIRNINLVRDALVENDPDALFAIFDGMDDQDLGIEYGFGLEITADKPVAGQRVGDPSDDIDSLKRQQAAKNMALAVQIAKERIEELEANLAAMTQERNIALNDLKKSWEDCDALEHRISDLKTELDKREDRVEIPTFEVMG